MRIAEYIEKMAYFPCYKAPKFIERDEEFEYYKFSIPKKYIETHVEEGGKWPGYNPSIWGDHDWEDMSFMFGMGYFPVYVGIEFLSEDRNFLYYKCRVPLVFIHSPYGIVYTFKKPEEMKSTFTDEDFKKMKEKLELREGMRYRLTFQCQNPQCQAVFTEESDDLWKSFYGRSCSKCTCKQLRLVKQERIKKE